MKILVVDSGLSAFIKPLVDWWLDNGNDVKHINGNNLLEINDLMHWADILWIEWANELAVAITERLKKHCPIIIRCHRYELYRQNMAYKINYNNVDKITFDVPFTRDIFHSNININKNKTLVIPNYIDLDTFSDPISSYKRPKSIGLLNYQHSLHKNLPLLLQSFYELLKQDTEYTLHIYGQFVEYHPEVWYYVERTIDQWGLKDKITFYDGGKNVKEVINWYRSMQYIACTSMVESTGLSLLEGMSQGCIPIIHDFPYREQLYPDKWSYRTSSEFVDLVLSSYNNKQENHREWVKDHFSLKDNVGHKINKLIKEIIG